MNSAPVLTARQMSANWFRDMQDRYPYHFSFVEEWDGNGTSDAEFAEMVAWINQYAGEKNKDWTVNGSPMGGSLTYWFKDAETAMLFKLTFVGTDG